MLLVALTAACAVGFILLARSADHLVIGSSALSARLGVPPVIVGVLVIGFGTSAPELLVSGLAAARGSVGLGVGNVLGSNIANLSLVLGVAAMIAPVVVQTSVVRREAPTALVASVLFAVAVQGGLTSREGVFLLLALVVVLSLMVVWSLQARVPVLGGELAEMIGEESTYATRRLVVQTVLGTAGTLAGAQVLVWGATGLAREANLSEGFVGLTIVAIGTSLPELMTAIQASRRGESDLLVGNLMGSNVFNALAVGGLVAVLGDGAPVEQSLTGPGVWLMLGVSVLALVFMGHRFRVGRWEGVTLLTVFFVSLPLIGVA